ncbi:MAG: vitamin B12 dependent-methionine synthase activation domain-containing protein [Prevotellaceae bacterium]|jgi:cobalamin-dependent methionine synthase I|nr:vitamin B12 dependent-methionine synthase activation domain-containing protein [Prevotellaceae bacterium]MDY6256676.1 vitamin B12 dependent-methionine synthase activation domain-containing protein [Bacteroidaceae bacterium]
MRKNYRISDLKDYINWVYFFHAWSLPQQSEESKHLFDEAQKMLQRLQPYVKVKTVVELMPAWSEGDDIVVQPMRPCECGQSHPCGEPIRLPMLRQQVPGKDGMCHCLSDFIRPHSAMRQDKIGIFATSTSIDVHKTFPDDDYSQMLLQTLADRLAEAGAERLHEEVRKTLWGYAPNEQLTMAELHQEKFQGIRPAVGYPCLPDISINFLLDKLIGFKSIGVTLTTSAMMQPHASVSGLMISLPQAHYFAVGKIDSDQLADYARRRQLPPEEIHKYISTIDI